MGERRKEAREAAARPRTSLPVRNSCAPSVGDQLTRGRAHPRRRLQLGTRSHSASTPPSFSDFSFKSGLTPRSFAPHDVYSPASPPWRDSRKRPRAAGAQRGPTHVSVTERPGSAGWTDAVHGASTAARDTLGQPRYGR